MHSFSQTVCMQCFIHITFKSITFWSANFPKVLVEHIVQWGKIHLCHRFSICCKEKIGIMFHK